MDNLDGDVTLEACVFCAVNFTHAASPDGSSDFVRPEPAPLSYGHIRVELYGRANQSLCSSSEPSGAKLSEKQGPDFLASVSLRP